VAGLRRSGDANVAVHAREIWPALDAANSRWRMLPLDARIAILGGAADSLARRGPGPAASTLAASAGLSAEGLAEAWHATFAPWTVRAIADAVAAEDLEARLAKPAGHRIVHILAGNVFPATWSMLARGALVGAAQWLRPSSREPLFAVAVAHALLEIAPVLAATFAVAGWPHEADDVASAVLCDADVVTAQGDDESVALVTATVARLGGAHTRFVGYGARWSAALLSQAAQTSENAARIARDVSLFDQQGCLSPSLVLAEDGERTMAWCAELAVALAARERECPRGAREPVVAAGLRAWRSATETDEALGRVRRLWTSERSTRWAVALLERGHFVTSPLDRHVVVVPFGTPAELEPLVARHPGALQGLACDVRDWRDQDRERVLRALRPTRTSSPGDLQLAPPSWLQDHRSPLATLLPLTSPRHSR
jgi:hypothetical protein